MNAPSPPAAAASPPNPDRPATAPPWHTLEVAEVAARLGTDVDRGLDPAEAARRLAEHGPNRLAQAPERSAWSILFAQFRNLVVYLLLVAAGLALATHEPLEAAAILVVIAINALIGFLTEWRADRALAALQRQVVPEAQVIRDGHEHRIPAAELVVGDLVALAAGDKVPADGRLVAARRLQLDEAPLTGESQPVTKQVEPVAAADTPMGDRVSLAYLGTAVADGRGRLIVTATGAATEMGRIGTLLESAGSQRTPLELKLEELGRTLILAVLALCGVIVIAGWLRGLGLIAMIETGLSLAIAAVPEGLPAVATTTLAIGMQRMARMRALIRRLPAVETLGSTTVICTDKTGTLTRSELTVQAVVLDGRELAVTGVGYRPDGGFRLDDAPVDPGADGLLTLAARIGLLCNDAQVQRSPEGAETILGDPTEAALIVLAEKAGLDPAAERRRYERVHEDPFDSLTMRMATVHRRPESEGGGLLACVKGSPAAVLAVSTRRATAEGAVPLTEADRQAALEANRALAGRALRVLGLAQRDVERADDPAELAGGLTYVGLVGMIDPLRAEAAEAIGVCRAAGIRTVMITGDQEATAAEIARQLGLDRDPHGRPQRVAHARELDGLDADGWGRLVGEASVFARVTPEHKLRIVEALQRRGEVVAMTGDGVNDAPALKRAEIGVAMGIKGTEVAKESADMIVTDDNFATIVGAVEQGRIIYANIERVIGYLFSCNSAEVVTVFIALMIGLPLPLVPLQILWMNMVTDVLPALALAVEPSAPGIMRRPPRRRDDRLLDSEFLRRVAGQGLLLALASLAGFRIGLAWYGTDDAGVAHARTLAFMTLCLGQIFHSLNCRSRTRSIVNRHAFRNAWLWAAIAVCLLFQTAAVAVPLLRRVLQTVPPNPEDFALVTALSLLPIAVIEAGKFLARHRQSTGPGPA